MAGPIPQEALYNALSREEQRQNMEKRSSNDNLLDEEGIALNVLSHQRSPITAMPALNADIRPPHLQTQFNSATNVAQHGWRRTNAVREDSARTDGRETLTLGRVYARMGKLSIIPRYFVYIFPLGLIIAIPIIVGALVPSAELGVISYS
jgi:hypothetical protein